MEEVIIVGGSSAGLSAALTLGRSLRRTIVLDDGKPCNRVSRASHGFLTQDGTAPAEIVGLARRQLEAYPTVEFVSETATAVSPVDGGFEVVTDTRRLTARKLLLATGVHDDVPEIVGMREAWGHGVLHCPYCDGYEVHHHPLGVYATSPHGLHQAMLLRQWTDDLTLYTDGALIVTDAHRKQLERHGIRIIESPLIEVRQGVEGLEEVVLADGRVLACRGLFIRPTSRPRTTFASDLGCVLDEHGLVTIDMVGRTSVAGVYAAGDLSNPRRSVALAVAQGVSAAHGINFDFVSEMFA
jgi:thioredoxin reductase